MAATFTLGRIAGIRIGVNWTVLAIFLLITFGLAGQVLPDAHPGEPALAYWVAGLLAALVFFASLLAHELAHATLARRNGIEVEGITLWLFGGVARIQGEAPDPAAEFRIAGVGPLVSLVLGFVFGVAAWLLGATGAHPLVVESAGWLSGINVLLAVFNAIPAAPLDGGRLLRSFLWWRTGDRLSSTIRASQAGRVFGWLLVVLGLLGFLSGGTGFGGLWMALIGWFLVSAATAEGQQAVVRDALAEIPVADVMTADPVTAPAQATVADFLDGDLFRRRHSGFPLVDDSGRPVGLVTLNRIKQVPQTDRGSTTLGSIACPLDEIAVVRPGEPVADLLPRLATCSDGRALVLDGDRVVGIVSPSDVSRTLEWISVSSGSSRRPPTGRPYPTRGA